MCYTGSMSRSVLGLALLGVTLFVACSDDGGSAEDDKRSKKKDAGADAALVTDGGAPEGSTSEAGLAYVDVPLTVVLRNSGGGKGLAVPLAVGASAAVPLLVDTGSAGVHILASDIAPGSITRTGRAVREEYVDGTELVGEEAMAQVSFGAARTGIIAIHVVDRVGCVSGRAGCSGQDGSDFFHAHGTSGIVGITLGNSVAEPAIYSPIAQIPGVLGSAYTIRTNGYAGTTGTLTLGNPPGGLPFAEIPLVRESAGTLPNGVPAWNDARVNVCYSVDNTPIQNDCGPSIFDTGATALFWSTNRLLLSQQSFGALAPGYTFHAKVDGVFEWSFTVANPAVPGVDMVLPSPGAFNTNLGVGIFFAYDIRYDHKAGKLGIRKR